MNDLTIRLLTTSDEMRIVQELERKVWNMEPIPIHQTITAVKNGGIMLGAFDGNRLIGFSYSFAGYAEGQVYLCSHQLGIDPQYQSKGIGKRLKDEQQAVARRMGYELLVWTFDPLESRNAFLNISKLHGICNTYIENCYGEMDDGLNKGLPTDRFQVSWWINSERVMKEWKPQPTAVCRPFKIEVEAGMPVLIQVESPIAGECIEVPVPQNFQQIKAEHPKLALDWRMKTREIFQRLFTDGYTLVDVRREEGMVHWYRLVRHSEIPLTTHKGEIDNDH